MGLLIGSLIAKIKVVRFFPILTELLVLLNKLLIYGNIGHLSYSLKLMLILLTHLN